MTQEQKRIKIAEVCGWTNVWDSRKYELGFNGYPPNYQGNINDSSKRVQIPDYFKDLDAMHEAERSVFRADIGSLDPMKWELWEKYTTMLADKFTGEEDVAFATAGERAESFGQSLNLWTE